jgi:hypothetical protein
MIIGVDFDGTCVDHMYPEIGADVPFAVFALDYLQKCGFDIILWTMRSGQTLDDAVEWFRNRDIKLYGINNNPQQHEWTNSPKAYANIYIDDNAIGCPLLLNPRYNGRPYVDWIKVLELIKERYEL